MGTSRTNQNQCKHVHMEMIGDNAARCKDCGLQTPVNHEAFSARTCRECGCTEADCRQCIEATGHPCHWVEPNLCSRCKDEIDADIVEGEAMGYFDIPGVEAAR